MKMSFYRRKQTKGKYTHTNTRRNLEQRIFGPFGLSTTTNSVGTLLLLLPILFGLNAVVLMRWSAANLLNSIFEKSRSVKHAIFSLLEKSVLIHIKFSLHSNKSAKIAKNRRSSTCIRIWETIAKRFYNMIYENQIALNVADLIFHSFPVGLAKWRREFLYAFH